MRGRVCDNGNQVVDLCVCRRNGDQGAFDFFWILRWFDVVALNESDVKWSDGDATRIVVTRDKTDQLARGSLIWLTTTLTPILREWD